MSVHIISGDQIATLFCSTSDWAFGPVFYEERALGKDAAERAEAFLRWLKRDAREFDQPDLERKYLAWLAQEAAQYRAEEAAEEA